MSLPFLLWHVSKRKAAWRRPRVRQDRKKDCRRVGRGYPHQRVKAPPPIKLLLLTFCTHKLRRPASIPRRHKQRHALPKIRPRRARPVPPHAQKLPSLYASPHKPYARHILRIVPPVAQKAPDTALLRRGKSGPRTHTPPRPLHTQQLVTHAVPVHGVWPYPRRNRAWVQPIPLRTGDARQNMPPRRLQNALSHSVRLCVFFICVNTRAASPIASHPPHPPHAVRRGPPPDRTIPAHIHCPAA
jgi:hypothetical protein